MEDLKVIFASNMITLRTKANLTQAELALKINYSDKSVSKWERAEALPDVIVVKSLADIFGVSVDYLLSAHSKWEPDNINTSIQRGFNDKMVMGVSMIGIWTLAVLVFVVFWIIGQKYWIIFIIAVPVSLITLLVLNSIWNERRHNMLIVLGIVFCAFALAYYILYEYKPWQLVFVLILAEASVILSYRIKRNHKAVNKKK
jgi:DNA-binding XRE family transcriptional regulator